MENHHFQWENPLFLWPFSIAMLVYQRVPPWKTVELPVRVRSAVNPKTATVGLLPAGGWWNSQPVGLEFQAVGYTLWVCVGLRGGYAYFQGVFFGILSWNCKKGCSVFCNLSPWELCSEREVEPLQCLRSLLEENRKLKEEAEAIFDVTLSINLDLWRRGPHRESERERERERCFPGGTMVIFCQ